MRALQAALLLAAAGAVLAADWDGFPDAYTYKSAPNWDALKVRAGVPVKLTAGEAQLKLQYAAIAKASDTCGTEYADLKKAFTALLAAYTAVTTNACSAKKAGGSLETTCEKFLRDSSCKTKKGVARAATACEASLVANNISALTTQISTLNSQIGDLNADISNFKNGDCAAKWWSTKPTLGAFQTKCEKDLRTLTYAQKLAKTPFTAAFVTAVETALNVSLVQANSGSCLTKWGSGKSKPTSETQCEKELRTTRYSDFVESSGTAKLALSTRAIDDLELDAETSLSDLTTCTTNLAECTDSLAEAQAANASCMTLTCDTKAKSANKAFRSACETALLTPKWFAGSGAKSKLAATSSLLTAAEKDLLAALTTLNTTCTREAGQCDSDLETCQETLTTVQAANATCTTKLAVCNATLATNVTALANCTSKLTPCTSSLASNVTALAKAKTDLGKCTVNATSLAGNLTLVLADLASCAANATDLTDQVASLTETNTRLSDDLLLTQFDNATNYQLYLDCQDNATAQADTISNFEEFPVRKLLKKRRAAA